MNANRNSSIIVLGATLVAIAALSATTLGQSPKKSAPVTYKSVQTVFNSRCISCHKGPKPPALMNLETYEGVMKGNDDGAVITPGHPEKSLLYTLITSTGRKKMPPKQPLAKADIATISAWIKAGAKNK